MRLGVLASFALDSRAKAAGQRLARLREADVPMIWDSGAWSVFTGAAHVDVDQHTEWVLANDRGQADVRYVGLDVIGDPTATLANYRRQKEAGANVEPTIHFGEPLDQVGRFLEVDPNPEWVNVGGLVPYMKQPKLHRNIAAFIAAVTVRLPEGTKVHALGCTPPTVMQHVHYDACDSIYWLTVSRVRTLSLFDRNRADWRRFTACSTTSDETRRRSAWKQAYSSGQWLRSTYGLEPADLVREVDDKRLLAAAIEAHAEFVRWASDYHDKPVTVYLAGSFGSQLALDALVDVAATA